MKGFRAVTLASLAALWLAATPMPAMASQVIMQTAGTDTGGIIWNGVGLDFDVNPGSQIRVLDLGVYDAAVPGIAGGATLSTVIFNADTQASLVRMDFDADDPETWSTFAYLFKPLDDPLLLGPGRYTIVSYGFNADNEMHNGQFIAPDPVFDGGGAIDFYQCRWGADPGTDLVGVYPTAYAGPGWRNYIDGPNMRFETLSCEAVPAPGAALLGLIGLGVVNRLRKHRVL